MINQEDTFKYELSYSQKEVEDFAKVTGDNNPIHLDKDYACQTMFKQPIMHGFLGASVFSKVFGTLFPGEGTIYLSQSMNFLRPMFVDTEYEAIFTVKEVNKEKHIATVETIVQDKNTTKVTVKGEARIMNKEKI